MRAVQADRPAAAALLRHGASLDRRNNARQSARDMAAAQDDPAIDRALGPAP
jgi:ankyrin repeat protein